MPFFTTRGATYPKVMHTIESGWSRQFFRHLAKSNRTTSSRDIKCWENYGGGVAVAAGAQYDYIHYDLCMHYKAALHSCMP